MTVDELKKNLAKEKNQKLKTFLSKTKNYLLKNSTATNLINKIDPNLILTKEYKIKKFDKISSNEIKKTVGLINSKINSKIKIKINEIDDDLFLLSKQ